MEAAPRTISTSNSRRYRFVQRLTFAFVSLFLILMAVIAIAWSVLNPQQPKFRVTSLSVSNFSVNDWEVRGMYEMGLSISNPNKKVEILVEDLKVVVYYGEVGVCEGRVNGEMGIGLHVGKMRKESVKVGLMKGSVSISKEKEKKKRVIIGEMGEKWRKGVVNLNVRMEVRIRYEDGNWPSRLKVLDVYCGDMDVGFFSHKHTPTGKLLGVGKDCHI